MNILLIAALCFTLSACSGEDNAQESKITESESRKATVQTSENAYSILNTVNFETGIPQETDRVQQSLSIDAQVQKILDEHTYTFETLKDSDIIVNAYGDSPLTALALFDTEEKCKVKVTVKGTSKNTDVSGTVDELSTTHRVPIVGLYAAKNNDVVIDLLDQNDKVISTRTFHVKTDPLPTTLDGAIKVYKHQVKSAYGLIEVSGFGTPYIYAFDEDGQIRWYLNEKYGCYGYYPLSGGKFIWMDGNDMIQTPEKPHSQNMYEADYLGRVYQIYYVQKGLHHEIIEKEEGGNLLVATSSLEGHFEETIQEIDRKTGQPVKTLTMNEIYGDTHVNQLDWAHINTISYYKEDDSLVVSTRNVHTVVKFNWTTNKIIWLLGDPSVWKDTSLSQYSLKPTGNDFDWQYQQHSAYLISEDLDSNPDTIEIGMFDNHWDDDAPIDSISDRPDSYVKFYSIDEKNKTISLLHEYASAKSRITSNWQADFNKKRVFSMCGYLKYRDQNDNMKGMMYEYDYDTEGVLNQWGSKYTYYRAYHFDIDLSACSKELKVKDNYFCGTVNAPKKEKQADIPEKVLESADVSYSILGNILKINAFDHSISKIEFVGKNNSYVLDLDYTGNGQKKFKKLSYNISCSFQNLEPDTYALVITYYKERINTGQTITVK